MAEKDHTNTVGGTTIVRGNIQEEQLVKIKREALLEATTRVITCVNYWSGDVSQTKACVMDLLIDFDKQKKEDLIALDAIQVPNVVEAGARVSK